MLSMDCPEYSPDWGCMPTVLTMVFQYLPVKDLNVCAQVCKIWAELAATVKRLRRKRISWCLFYNSQDFDMSEYCEDAFAEYVDNLFVEPKFVLVLGNRNWSNAGEQYVDMRRPPFSDIYRVKLPASCESFLCTSPDVIGTSSDCSRTIHLKHRRGLTAIFFPALPGLEIHTFHIVHSTILRSCAGIYDDTNIKCLLFLQNYENSTWLNELQTQVTLQNWFNQYMDRSVVGGVGVGNPVFKRSYSQYKAHSFGLAFAGDNVEAASITFDYNRSYEESEIFTRLQKFNDSNVTQGQCLAFFLSHNTYSGTVGTFSFSKEVDIFRSLFPTIPLFSFSGKKYFGITRVLNHSNELILRHTDDELASPSKSFIIISVRV